MKKLSLLVLLAFALLMSSSCQPAPQSPTPAPPPATDAPIAVDIPTPTDIPLPTATSQPSPTPLPDNVIFRDDFKGELQPGWEWQYENPDLWKITEGGWLSITGEHDSLLGENYQSNLLWYPLPEGDFIITVHMKTSPSENFQQSAIFIYEDPKNYVTINRGFCGICDTGGNGFYMDYKIGKDWGSYKTKTAAEDVYLRLESNQNTITGYYATEPDQWQRLGRVGNYFDFKKVGLGVSNAGSYVPLVGLFDYFEIARP